MIEIEDNTFEVDTLSQEEESIEEMVETEKYTERLAMNNCGNVKNAVPRIYRKLEPI
ncbi:20176_t:CDS:1, partial [Racocetra fulgida]